VLEDRKTRARAGAADKENLETGATGVKAALHLRSPVCTTKPTLCPDPTLDLTAVIAIRAISIQLIVASQPLTVASQRRHRITREERTAIIEIKQQIQQPKKQRHWVAVVVEMS
jgi:hypothetical protein